MDINIQILMEGRSTSVFLGEQRKDMNTWFTSWQNKRCSFPANGEAQQHRGYRGTPQDSAAEGKTILKQRRKTAPTLQQQAWPSLSTSADMSIYVPVCGEDAALWDLWEGFCVLSESGTLVGNDSPDICCHASPEPVPAESKQSHRMSENGLCGRGILTASLSKPFQRHYVFSNACIALLASDLQPSTELLLYLNDRIISNDTIKLMFQRNNWVSGHGAAKLTIM